MSIQEIVEVFAWPAVAIFGLLLFRGPITRFLDRARKIGRDGVEAGPEQAEQLQAQVDVLEGQGSPLEKKSPPWSEMNQSPVLLEEMGRLRKVLDERHASEQHRERETLLIAALAESGIINNFLQIYRLIYGSQLDALDLVNSFSPTKPDSVTHFYDYARSELPELTFEAWLDFLVVHNLILRDETGLTITLKGREFLAYLARWGLRGIPKPY